jgi:ADP-ribosylglycohydrolase
VRLDDAQRDRAAGVLLAGACGDALGAGYEFGPPMQVNEPIGMVGGGPFGWAPGEWTDDTSMAIPIARAAAAGADLHDESVLDGIVAEWVAWARKAKDVGNQTAAVLGHLPAGTAKQASARARRVHERDGRSGGNGSLMRTAPVALAFLGDPDGLVAAATRISALTHFDPEAGEACAIWCLAIGHAVLHGTFDGVWQALDHLPGRRRDVWAQRLAHAEANVPATFDRNGWVVQALQGAWSAISGTPVPRDDPAAGRLPGAHLQLAMEAAVRGGGDTDTVAAIAGGLLGARWGASAVPLGWQRILHGWPCLRARDLVDLAVLAAGGGRPERSGWLVVPALDPPGYGDVAASVAHPTRPRGHPGGPVIGQPGG